MPEMEMLATMYFWKNKNSTTKGSALISATAIRGP